MGVEGEVEEEGVRKGGEEEAEDTGARGRGESAKLTWREGRGGEDGV